MTSSKLGSHDHGVWQQSGEQQAIIKACSIRLKNQILSIAQSDKAYVINNCQSQKSGLPDRAFEQYNCSHKKAVLIFFFLFYYRSESVW